jgi:hypothetical protein
MAKTLILAVIFVLISSLSFAALSIALPDTSPLQELISQNEDTLMSVNDLAFFLATHDFDATPDGDHVEVRTSDAIYELVPNGRYVGLANVTIT